MLLRISILLALVLVLPLNAQVGQPDLWPGWRGDGSGISLHAAPPQAWARDRNVLWRTELPGEGSSSPIVWKD